MPSYSFYLLDPSGNTYDYLVKTCPSDQAACDDAMNLFAGASDVEIWHARRLIGRVSPSTVAAKQPKSTGIIVRWFDHPLPSLTPPLAAST